MVLVGVLKSEGKNVGMKIGGRKGRGDGFEKMISVLGKTMSIEELYILSPRFQRRTNIEQQRHHYQ